MYIAKRLGMDDTVFICKYTMPAYTRAYTGRLYTS